MTDTTMTDRGLDPRTVHTRRVVLEATAALLAEEGFQRLTFEGIAERSGVARSTIYRNWASRSALLAEAYDLLCEFPDIPDLGSMTDELHFMAERLRDGLADGSWAPALPSLIGAARHDAELQAAQSRFSEARRIEVGSIFVRAAERGEIAGNRDPHQLAEMFGAGFFFRFLMTGQPIDDDFVASHVAAIVALAAT